jgi:hypothetical protein
MQGHESASNLWVVKNLFLAELGVLFGQELALFLKKIKKGIGLN